MPDMPSNPKCEKCERVIQSVLLYQIGETVTLVDLDGDVIYDFVKVCKCGRVFHWHTKERTLVEYSAAFERLMRHYRNGDTIKAENNLTG